MPSCPRSARLRAAGGDRLAQRAVAELVPHAIPTQPGAFRLDDIAKACPGVGRGWIGSLLEDLQDKGCHRLVG